MLPNASSYRKFRGLSEEAHLPYPPPVPYTESRRLDRRSILFKPHFHIIYTPQVMRVSGQNLYFYAPSVIYQHPLRYIPLSTSDGAGGYSMLPPC
ncbi:unnamed protein product [Mesocestoides corti]|uniref:Uncharacterized protein n=1 Tax=Mesocestoides corti TaxID=53468 RepID=A0A0R3U9F0_MESCO|nr:unnamed protein product [Mesocestoides corti]